ncbi:MAG: helix-turn-helix transcriptional regulator [Candidatus Omnitrophica bacterium]|nr:helix-turn-helix transcriptional regulator [Candidatus Omnitrophota bacterium]
MKIATLKIMIPNDLPKLLKNCNLTQKEFARQIGKTEKMVSFYIRGIKTPKIKDMPRWMRVLKVNDINHIFFLQAELGINQQ